MLYRRNKPTDTALGKVFGKSKFAQHAYEKSHNVFWSEDRFQKINLTSYTGNKRIGPQ
jgi:hypothetical protein